jgi:hypothetical protein
MMFCRSLHNLGGVSIVALLAAMVVAVPTPAAAQTVVAGHPRLYVRPADLTALRTRVTQEPISTYHNQMKSRMDGAVARHSNNEVAAFEMESLALLHLIAGGTAYRDKILNTWRFQSYAAGQVDHWSLPYQVMAHSLALDYLWSDLTAAQRTSLGNVIVAMMDDLYNYSPHNVSYANAMSDYSNVVDHVPEERRGSRQRGQWIRRLDAARGAHGRPHRRVVVSSAAFSRANPHANKLSMGLPRPSRVT